MPRHALRLAACATAFHLLGATTGVAQRATLTGVVASTTHDLLDRPIGLVLSLATPVGRRADIQVSVGRLQGTNKGTGVVCGGLINPNQCPSEPYEQTGRLSFVAFGADFHVFSSRLVELSLQPQFLWGRARTETEGNTTGNRLFSEKGQYGFSGGLELRAFPVRRVPLGVVIGGAFSRLGPTRSELLLDGYTPFDEWYSVRTVSVGVVYQWPRSRR
jgi:hypothetical protein